MGTHGYVTCSAGTWSCEIRAQEFVLSHALKKYGTHTIRRYKEYREERVHEWDAGEHARKEFD